MSKCNLISCSGADDNTDIAQLLDLAVAFPCIEISIQISKNISGTPGFPTIEWIQTYSESVKERISSGQTINSSLHINRDYCHDIFNGKAPSGIESLLNTKTSKGFLFSRLQFNFYSSSEIRSNTAKVYVKCQQIKQFVQKWPQRMILQYNELNKPLFSQLHEAVIDFDILFDSSFGTGKVPVNWPTSLPGYFCAYSGGLGPHNLAKYFSIIKNSVCNQHFGLDAHTGLRDNNNQFSIEKVNEFVKLSLELGN